MRSIKLLTMLGLAACIISLYTIQIYGLNVVFICFEREGKEILGSTLMRGFMMKDTFNKMGMNAHVIYTRYSDDRRANSEIVAFANNYNITIHACIFVKYFSIDIANTCADLKALSFFDMIDNEYDMRYLIKLIQLSSKNTLQQINKENDLQFMLGNAHDAVWFTQSDYLTNFTNQIGIMSYTLPHHHSNTNKWGLSMPTNKDSTKLVIGILYGNYKNEPNIEFILEVLCTVNAKLWLVNQHIGLGVVGASSELITTRTEYECISQHKINITTRSFKSKRTFSSKDIYGQAIYYTDKALEGIDIGLLLPRKYDNSSKIAINTVDMLRPPTRFLHWLSRGVPTLYYPTLAYQDIANKYNYGHSVNKSLSIRNTTDFINAINFLQFYEVRKSLSMEGLTIAEDFSIQNIAKNMIKIIENVQIKNFTSYIIRKISKNNRKSNLKIDRNFKELNTKASIKSLEWILVTGCTGFIGFHLIQKLLNTNILCYESFDGYFPTAMRYQRMQYLRSKYKNMKFELGNYNDHNSYQFLISLLKRYRIYLAIHLDTLPNLSKSCIRLNTNNNIVNIKYLRDFIRILTGENHDRNIEFFYISDSQYLYSTYIKTDPSNPFIKSLNEYFNNAQKYFRTSLTNEKIMNSPANEILLKFYQLEYDLKYTLFQIYDTNMIYGSWKAPNILIESNQKQIQSNNPWTSFPILNCDKHIIHDPSNENLIYIEDVVNAMNYFIQKKIDSYLNKKHSKNDLDSTIIKFTQKKIPNFESNFDKSIDWKYYNKNSSMKQEYFTYLPNIINTDGITGGLVMPLTSIDKGNKEVMKWYQTYTKNKWDCSSECVMTDLCMKTDLSNALIHSRNFTKNCNIVVYTIILFEKSKIPKLPIKFLDIETCAIAFTIGKSYPNNYNNWQTIKVDIERNFLVKTLLKLSPKSFFSVNVKYAIYIDSSLELIKSPSEIINYKNANEKSNDRGKKAAIIAIRNSEIDNNFENLPINMYINGQKDDFFFKEQIQHYHKFSTLFNIEYNNIIDTSMLIYDLKSNVGHDFRCQIYEETLQWNTFQFDDISSAYILSIIARLENNKGITPKQEWNVIGSNMNHQFEYIRILSLKSFSINKPKAFIRKTT